MSNLEKTAKTLLDHNVQKRNAAEKAEQSLTLAYNGGLFKVTPFLIDHTGLFRDGFDYHYLKDEYDNPIRFTMDEWFEFHKKAKQKYQEVMNDWYNEYEELKRVRKPEQL